MSITNITNTNTTLTMVGDIMLDRYNSKETLSTFDNINKYERWDYISDYLNLADIRLGNLETAITDNKIR